MSLADAFTKSVEPPKPKGGVVVAWLDSLNDEEFRETLHKYACSGGVKRDAFRFAVAHGYEGSEAQFCKYLLEVERGER